MISTFGSTFSLESSISTATEISSEVLTLLQLELTPDQPPLLSAEDLNSQLLHPDCSVQHQERLTSFAFHCCPLERSKLVGIFVDFFLITELRLDAVGRTLGEQPLPLSHIFKSCPMVKVVSLKSNYLDRIPADIGRLSLLQKLYLTNNRLGNWSIPYTLCFCKNLTELYLDQNLLDALPATLLSMKSLRTVHRHGNHNYFKATFMWYHTNVYDRILETSGRDVDLDLEPDQPGKQPKSLLALAYYGILSSKWNFYCSDLPTALIDRISQLIPDVNRCDHCSSVKSGSRNGFKVFTFKNPYLGNTCVPFLHWACSLKCAFAIDIPARVEQNLASFQQDLHYERYIRESIHLMDLAKRGRKWSDSIGKKHHCQIL